MEDVDIIDLINNYQEKDLIIDKNNCNEIIFRYNHLGENDEIDSFYIKQNLEFKIKEMINKINKKIENGIVLSSDENQVLYNIYINKLSNKFPIYHNFIIKNHLLNKKIIPREIFKYVFKDFVETCMKEINDNTIKQYTPFCFIENLNKNIEEKKYVCGFLTNNSFDIYIDEKLVDMVYNGNYNGIETVFHELTHLKQHIEIKHNIVNGDIIKYIKEQILTKYSSTYYQENYKSISYEVDARIMGTFYTNKYLKTLGFTEKKRGK